MTMYFSQVYSSAELALLPVYSFESFFFSLKPGSQHLKSIICEHVNPEAVEQNHSTLWFFIFLRVFIFLIKILYI